MSNSISCFSEKMNYLFMDIIGSLGRLPVEQRGYLFGFDDEIDMDRIHNMACYITMEYIKYSFDYDDPEYSLRHFRKENDTDDERMRQSRIMEYVLKYKKREIDILGVELPPEHKYTNVSMDTIDKKLKGYRLTEMNYFEHQNIHDLDIIKAIVENRIGNTKKVSNTHFHEIISQYDDYIEDVIGKSKKSDLDLVFNSIAFFTFEWRYPVELFYYIACIMEESGMQEVNKSDLILLCGDVRIESMFSGWVSTHSRMVRWRFFFASVLFNKTTPCHIKEDLRTMIKELIALGFQYKETRCCDDGTKYIDWFRSESNISDWASFYRYYDVFSIWKRKELTPKRIQNMRKLFTLTSMKKI